MHNLKIHFFLFSTIAPKRLKSSHSSKIRFIIEGLPQISQINTVFLDQLALRCYISLCSQGFYHKPFETRLISAVHQAGIVGIGLVILLFHVVKIVHYLHHLVFGAVMLLLRRTKQAVGLGMTGITLLDMLD